MAIIDKKQTRWYSKSTFDSLDKTTIPVGTEIQVTGEIEETDLTADLQTKINGKLTAPTTPTADSVVTMAANGTTGTKALSEFGGKLYKHSLIGIDPVDIIATTSNLITTYEQFIENMKYFIMINCYYSGGTWCNCGVVAKRIDENNHTLYVYSPADNKNYFILLSNDSPTMSDTVTEL